ncbi:MAG: hypothetical protein GF313_06520 [Caldithrix sp.]|nr:hypothetical protein [Caldithrix sp.]
MMHRTGTVNGLDDGTASLLLYGSSKIQKLGLNKAGLHQRMDTEKLLLRIKQVKE